MSYELERHEAVPAGLRRIADEQVGQAIESLEAAGGDRWDGAVHDARKRCKKVRAVARLGRDRLGDHYSPINTTYRDVSRRLSDARDAWVFVETADLLADLERDHPGRADVLDALGAVRDPLHDRYLRIREEAMDSGAVAAAVEELTVARTAIGDWPLDGIAHDDLVDAIARIARRARGARDACAGTALGDLTDSTEDWHEWRKRVKYLWYVLRLTGPAWPDVRGPEADAMKRLSDHIGDEHDLGELHPVVTGLDIDADVRDIVLQQIAVRRVHLRRLAWPLGGRLLVEQAEAMAQRLVGTLDVWHERGDV